MIRVLHIPCFVIAAMFLVVVSDTHAAATETGFPKHLTGASSSNFPPVNLLDEDGNLVGFGRDVSDAVARAIGVSVSHIHSPIWTNVLKWLDSGQADFIHDTGYAPDRTEYLDYSEPILQMPEEIFVLSDRFEIQTFESLYGKRVACVNQHITHLYLKNFPRINCVIVKTPRAGVKALIDGEVDALIYPREIVHFYAYALKAEDRIKSIGEPLRTLTWHMVVRKGNAKVLLMLNRGIARIRANGELERIYDKWFGRALSKSNFNKQVLLIFGGIVLFIMLTSAVIFVWNWTLRRTVKARSLALNESEERFDLLASVAPVGIFETDADGRCVRVNDRWCEIAGLTGPDAYGDGWAKALHPEDRETVFEQWNLSASRRIPFSLEYRFQHPDGRVTWVLGQSKAITDQDNEIRGYVGSVTDITAHKDLELQLAQAQKIEAVGQLTGGVAHDFNNLLAATMGNAQLLVLKSKGRDDLQALAKSIVKSVERGAELTQRLLAFSRRQTLQPKSLQLGALCEGMTDLLKRSLGETIEIVLATHAENWDVLADPNQVESALLNLAINASHAMPNGGKLAITVENAPVTSRDWAERR